MRAISLWEPWASLMALGIKTIETRRWCGGYVGTIARIDGYRPVGGVCSAHGKFYQAAEKEQR